MYPVFRPKVQRRPIHKGTPSERIIENVASCSLWCSDEDDVQKYRTRLGMALNKKGHNLRGRPKDEILDFIEDELHPDHFVLDGQDFLHNPYFGTATSASNSAPSFIEIYKRMEPDTAILWGYISRFCIQEPDSLVMLVTLWIGKHEKAMFWCDFAHESVGAPVRQVYYSRNTNVPTVIFRAYLASEHDPTNANWERDND